MATDQIADTGQLTFDVALPAWLQDRTLQVSAISPELTPTVDLLLLAPDRVQITLDSVRYYTSVLLESTRTGDFDSDGDVDGKDFLIWQIGFGISSGASLTDGDANRDGKVDTADLQMWQTNFGVVTTASVAANSFAIPEPASATHLLCGLVAMLLTRAASTSYVKSFSPPSVTSAVSSDSSALRFYSTSGRQARIIRDFPGRSHRLQKRL